MFPGHGNIAILDGAAYSYDDPLHVHAVTAAGANSYDYDVNGKRGNACVCTGSVGQSLGLAGAGLLHDR